LIYKRPKSLPSTTEQRQTGCGNLYITVTRDKDKPIEVFVFLGKSGGCSIAQNEALGKSVSIGLQHGIAVKEFVKLFSGVRCPSPNLYPEEDCNLSCADAIGSVLKKYLTKEEIEEINNAESIKKRNH
jgi:ribonucleoside-diphosphate reductase alpha chain